MTAFEHDAVNCTTAILNGETPGGLYLKQKLLDCGFTPLQLAVFNNSPALTKFLLQRGESVDVRCDFQSIKQATLFDIAILNIGFNGKWHPWTPHKSIFELLVLLCVMRRYRLEIVRLLAQNTKDIKEHVTRTFIDCAVHGKLVETCALLIVAPELLMSAVEGGLSCLDIFLAILKAKETRTEIEEGLLLLLDLFATSGDKFIAYTRLRQDIIADIWKEQEIAHLLRDDVRIKSKQGGSYPDDYYLRFFKPVISKPELGAQTTSLDEYVELEVEGNYKASGATHIVSFGLKRTNIDLDHINSELPDLMAEDADRLNGAIEKKLSSWPPLRKLPQIPYENSKRAVEEKLLPQVPVLPFLSQISHQRPPSGVRMFHTWRQTCPTLMQDYKYAVVQINQGNKANGAAKLIKASKFKSLPSSSTTKMAEIAAGFTSIAKRFLK